MTQLPDIPPLEENADGCDLDDVLRMNDAMIRFFFKENPDDLSDEDYAGRMKELKWLGAEGLLRGIKL